MKLIRSKCEDFWDGTLNSQKSAFTEWSLQDFPSLASRRYLTTCSQAQRRGLLTGGDLGLIGTETVPKAVSKWSPQRCCLINTPISSGPTRALEPQTAAGSAGARTHSSGSPSVCACVPGHFSIQEKGHMLDIRRPGGESPGLTSSVWPWATYRLLHPQHPHL